MVLERLIEKYPELKPCLNDIEEAYKLMLNCYRQGGKLLICGNGGSASDAEHIVGELMKGFKLQRPVPEEVRAKLTSVFPEEGEQLASQLQGALPAISLMSHGALISAFSNDVAPDMIFAQQVYGYGKPGDVVLGLSTSGNSNNVVKALKVAKAMGLHTVAMTGSSGGKMKALAEVTIAVPWSDTPDIQERHLPIYHALCLMLEEAFFQ